MTSLPSSERPGGLFISVDGPSGAGKTTIAHHLAQRCVAAGESRVICDALELEASGERTRHVHLLQ